MFRPGADLTRLMTGSESSEAVQTRLLRERNTMAHTNAHHAVRSEKGFSLIELLIVVVFVGVMTTIAVPQMINQRRLMRSNAVVREVMTQMRYARQLAMSQQQAVTFQYDNISKVIRIIDHNNDPTDFRSGTAVLVAAGYPSTGLPARVVLTIPLAQGGVPASEISYGIPTTSTGLPTGAATIPTGALGDGISMTALDTNSRFNVTFQADGSVINPSGIPTGPPAGVAVSQGIPMDQALFIFNNKAAQGSAAAISVLGASGRIKVWRYNVSANQYKE
jgi:prepilin-type N-terminal cleavage/methylation domain-containing protein